MWRPRTTHDREDEQRRSRPDVSGLTVLLALLAGLLCLASTGCTEHHVRAAVASDAPTGGGEDDGALHLVHVAAGGSILPVRIFVAAGNGPHPTLLLLHDLPAVELHLDLAHAVRRAGWSVVVPDAAALDNGLMVSNSSKNMAEMAEAALTLLRSGEATARFRIDPERIAVLGHGVGGGLALRAVARDTALVAAASLAGYGSSGQDSVAAREGVRVSVVGSTTPLAELAHGLRHRPVLLLAAADDSLAPVATHHEPLVEALRRNGPWVLVHRVLDTDHQFTSRRIELATAVLGWLQMVDRTWVHSAKID